jgi:hypothetical protein
MTRTKMYGTAKLFAIAAAAWAFSATVAAAGSPAGSAPQAGELSPAEVARKVEARGYTNAHDVEYDDGRWEVEATSSSGLPVELTVDAATGEILREDPS